MINKIQGYTFNLAQQNIINKPNQSKPSFGSVWRDGENLHWKEKNEAKLITDYIQRIQLCREKRNYLTTLAGTRDSNFYYNAIEKLKVPIDTIFYSPKMIFRDNFIVTSQARCLIEEKGRRFIRPILRINDVHFKDFQAQAPVGFTISDDEKLFPITFSLINDHAKDSPLQELYKQIFNLIWQIDYKF